MFPEFTARTEFPRNAHPGTVTFVGPDGLVREESAEQIPDWLKFAPGADGRPVPVVRVVRLSGPAGYSLRSYGADGRLLWVTLPVPPAPLSAPSAPPVTAEPALATAGASGWF
jgi:hypothetical protein